MSIRFIQTNEIEDRELRFRFDETADVSRADGSVVQRLTLHGRAYRTERGVQLRADFAACCRLVCARCLEVFDWEVSEPVELTVVSEAVAFGAGEVEFRPEDAGLLHAPAGRVDLREVAWEQLDLALPMKPLCAASCRGLCPTCGSNRNSLECGCPERVPDPRLAPLLALKKGAGRR